MKIITGIASTTHVDEHDERMTKKCLSGMAEQIREKLLPYLMEHDQGKQIGVIFYGEVFQLSDGEYALGVVSGIFEESEEKIQLKIGEPNNVWQDYKKYLDVKELIDINKSKSLDMNKQEKRSRLDRLSLNIADLLEIHLNSTQVQPDGRVFKIKRCIGRTGDLRVEIYAGDHDADHFHVVSKQRKINARFNMETLEYIDTKWGKIKRDDIKKIKNFFELNSQKLTLLRSEAARLSQLK